MKESHKSELKKKSEKGQKHVFIIIYLFFNPLGKTFFKNLGSNPAPLNIFNLGPQEVLLFT